MASIVMDRHGEQEEMSGRGDRHGEQKGARRRARACWRCAMAGMWLVLSEHVGRPVFSSDIGNFNIEKPIVIVNAHYSLSNRKTTESHFKRKLRIQI
jgi:hypothetical protein